MDKIINTINWKGTLDKILNWAATVDSRGILHVECNGYQVLVVRPDKQAYFFPAALQEHGISTTILGKEHTFHE